MGSILWLLSFRVFGIYARNSEAFIPHSVTVQYRVQTRNVDADSPECATAINLQDADFLPSRLLAKPLNLI